MRIIVFDNLSLNKLVNEVKARLLKLAVVFGKSLKGFEQILCFVDGIVLHELLILLDNFGHERFSRLQTSFAAFCYITQIL